MKDKAIIYYCFTKKLPLNNNWKQIKVADNVFEDGRAEVQLK